MIRLVGKCCIPGPTGQSHALQKEANDKGDVGVDFLRMHQGHGYLKYKQDAISAGGGSRRQSCMVSSCM